MQVEIHTMCSDKYTIQVLQNMWTFVIAFLIANSEIELFLLLNFSVLFAAWSEIWGQKNPSIRVIS